MAQTAFKTNPVLLEELLRDCEQGKIQLPDFQRSWVWDEDRIRSLISSISQAFPVGALMTLETHAGAAETFARRPIQGTPKDASGAIKRAIAARRPTANDLAVPNVHSQSKSSRPLRRVRKLVKRWFYIDIEKSLRPDVDREDAIFSIPEDRKIKEDFDRKVVLDLSTPEAEYQNLMFPLEPFLRLGRVAGWIWRLLDC